MKIISDIVAQGASGYNEAEVRFHIIDPILRKLGYEESEDVYILLEERIEYPYLHFGRRSKKDVPLGIPDYRCGLKGARGSFVVEAKAGNVPITLREIEQGHSYASHSKVQANYYVVCNGLLFEIFETLSGSDAKPLVCLAVGEINEKFYKIENILSPDNLKKNCKINYDENLKIADGFRSSVVIRSGVYSMYGYDYQVLIGRRDCTEMFKRSPEAVMLERQLEQLKTDFELRVSDGFIERGEDGRIIARVEFKGVTRHNDSGMNLLGIKEIQFSTSEKFISINSDDPTMFESVQGFSAERGSILNGMFGESIKLPSNIRGDIFVVLAMYLNGATASGQYVCISQQTHANNFGNLHFSLNFSGTFDLILDA